LNRKSLLLFFVLPFLGALGLILLASALNRSSVRRSVDTLVGEQLDAAAGILATGVRHALEEGTPPAQALDFYAGAGEIYYLALLDADRKIVAWRSVFEGYLPLSLQAIPASGSWIIDSPAGRIFNHFGPLGPVGGRSFYLYLGYSLEALEAMSARSRRTALIIFAVIAAAGLVVFRGLSLLQSGYLDKAREAEESRAEKERFREISAFTSGVAHEIKNPLNSLSLIFGLLEKKAPEDLAQNVSVGKREVLKISRIVDRFSDVLRPLAIRPETFPIGQAFASVMVSLASEFPGGRERIRFEGQGDLPVHADPDLVAAVLGNLLRNALEAASAGEIVVRAERDRRRVRLFVRDSGPGIPADRLARVFEPFFSTKEGGMGIGLYLAARIMEAHGGRIEVRSREGAGAEFIVTVAGG
jgi:signal transduction histidine kinase